MDEVIQRMAVAGFDTSDDVPSDTEEPDGEDGCELLSPELLEQLSEEDLRSLQSRGNTEEVTDQQLLQFIQRTNTEEELQHQPEELHCQPEELHYQPKQPKEQQREGDEQGQQSSPVAVIELSRLTKGQPCTSLPLNNTGSETLMTRIPPTLNVSSPTTPLPPLSTGETVETDIDFHITTSGSVPNKAHIENDAYTPETKKRRLDPIKNEQNTETGVDPSQEQFRSQPVRVNNESEPSWSLAMDLDKQRQSGSSNNKNTAVDSEMERTGKKIVCKTKEQRITDNRGKQPAKIKQQLPHEQATHADNQTDESSNPPQQRAIQTTVIKPSNSSDTYLTGLQHFWEHNYREGEQESNTRLLPAEVFALYIRSKWYQQESYELFIRLSTIITGPAHSSRLSKMLTYNAIPVSTEAKQFHAHEEETKILLHNMITEGEVNREKASKDDKEIHEKEGKRKRTNRERKKPTKEQKENNNNIMNKISKFWYENYDMHTNAHAIKAWDVFRYFTKKNKDSAINYNSFSQFSGQIVALQRTPESHGHNKMFYAHPKNSDCIHHHNDTANQVEEKKETQKALDANSSNGISTFREEKPQNSHKTNIKTRNNMEEVELFWKTHYRTEGVDTTTSIPMIEVFQFFQSTDGYQGETFEEFKQLTQMSIKPKTRRTIDANQTSVLAKPATFRCYLVHISGNNKTVNPQSKTRTTAEEPPNTPETVLGTMETDPVEEEQGNTTKDVDLFLINMQGLVTNKKNKCPFLHEVTESSKGSKIIAVTETWGKKHFKGEYLHDFQGFDMNKSDRITEKPEHEDNQEDGVERESEEEGDNNLQGTVKDEEMKKFLTKRGGVLLLTSKDIPQKLVLEFSNSNCELLISELPTINTAVLVFYRPSGVNFSLKKYSEAMKKVQEYLSSNQEREVAMEVLLVGDFNFNPDEVSWEKTTEGILPVRKEGKTSEKRALNTLLDISEDFGLHQVVDKPTREQNILDLVFTSQIEQVQSCEVQIVRPLSDHNLVKCRLKCLDKKAEDSSKRVKASQFPISTFNFEFANDEDVIKELRATKWNDLIKQHSDPTKFNEAFRKAIEEAAKRAKVPKYNKGERSEHKEIRKLMKERTKTHDQLGRENTEMRLTDKANLVARIEEINKEILEAKQNEVEKEEKKVIEQIKINPKSFFRYANRKRKTREVVGPLKFGNGKYTDDPKKMAEILSNQYESVFSKPSPRSNLSNLKGTDKQLDDITFSVEDIEAAMGEIKAGSAPGPDEIPAIVFHKYANAIATPVMRMWRISLDAGVMPEGTILAIITPIYKGDGKSEACNYRPVALTNHITKIFERVIRKKIIAHLEENALLNITQHGFTQGRSTITQLLAYYDTVLSMLEGREEKNVEVIYLDFAKAFDKVDHKILLAKLSKLGICGKLHKWIEVFLNNRIQRVRVDGHLSDPKVVKSGVPQGSVLGPLLFLIMMLDIDASTSYAKLGSFADDTRVWYTVTTINEQHQLQADLDSLYTWAADNNFKFNEKKFENLSYGKTKQGFNFTTPNNTNIKGKDHVKDLGVHFSSSGTFEEHIKKIVSEGKRLSGYILRTFKTRDVGTMLTLLKSLLVSKLEYACIVWAPTDKKMLRILENIQRSFTSRINIFNEYDTDLGRVICKVDYWKRLKALKIFSLERRRERYLLLYIYKIFIGLCPNPGFEMLTLNERTGYTVRAKIDRNAATWVQQLRNSSFFVTGPSVFNKLPTSLRKFEIPDIPTKQHVAQYKKKLDEYLWRIPDQPDVNGLVRAAESNSLIHQINYYE